MEASEQRSAPGVLVVGSSGVGKRTLLSRLLSVDLDDSLDASEIAVQGWSINTKYYTADVSVWTAHLGHDFSLPSSTPLVALVMVFDLSEPSTLAALQDWVSRTDIKTFDILLCIGNKVDRLPHHPAHLEYRRRLLKANLDDQFGISDTEGTGLLGGEDPSLDVRATCLDWCRDNNIEFIEACASNHDFDKCLSVDGDSQGVERLFGALSAHMWPGMLLKSGDKINEPVLPDGEGEVSEEESEYELEYEVLSVGSAEPWEDVCERWVSASETPSTSEVILVDDNGEKLKESSEKEQGPSASRMQPQNDIDNEEGRVEKAEMEKLYEFEDLEQLMSEIGNIRDNLRLMPDFQRREMAANLAMKMAAMFGGDSDNEDGHD
ncbi:PREDICTED: uncharacterized protein LOC104826450 [Tarenaya hassleriana]|uniref:uncharacterized protein LOC104826450 n=1 Tax=Tarenaya hassleriana TaxID=28532 RepID=UPI00053C83EC|nr:PREDICTED: uncharacterized protein LOC104826450 [Tarenaya hassleriana]